MQIGKRQRFEIFKRDGFTCQYCGRKPPEVLLEVDHIIAQANGGTDDDLNLLTSCQDCNKGKSDIPLSALPPSRTAALEERQEKLDQMRALAELIVAENEHLERLFQMVCRRWLRMFNLDAGELPEISLVKFKTASQRFLKLLPIDEVLEAVDIAAAKLPDDEDQQFRYFCGICWKKIRDNRENGPPAPPAGPAQAIEPAG